MKNFSEHAYRTPLSDCFCINTIWFIVTYKNFLRGFVIFLKNETRKINISSICCSSLLYFLLMLNIFFFSSVKKFVKKVFGVNQTMRKWRLIETYISVWWHYIYLILIGWEQAIRYQCESIFSTNNKLNVFGKEIIIMLDASLFSIKLLSLNCWFSWSHFSYWYLLNSQQNRIENIYLLRCPK